MHNYDQYIEANRQLWNAKTPIHAKSDFYDMDSFKAGRNALTPIELEGLGVVDGKSLLHLQCHFGQDTLSWARMGATVTGMDLSEEAIALARSVSEELHIPARFVCCNLYDLKDHLEGQFDIVFTSYGTITWLPDLDRWAAVVDHFLKPGGTFYIADFHPYIWMFDDEHFEHVEYGYFNPGEPYSDEPQGTYADKDAPIKMKEYFWNHALSETVTALLNRGLQLEALQEFPFSPYNNFPNMVEKAPGQWVMPHLDNKVPYIFSIKARKPV